MITSLSSINMMTRPNRPTNAAARATNPRFAGETESVTTDLNNSPQKRTEAFMQMIRNQDVKALKEALPQGFILLQPPDHKAVFSAGMESGNPEIQTMMASQIDYLEEKDKNYAMGAARYTKNQAVIDAAKNTIFWLCRPFSIQSSFEAAKKAREAEAVGRQA